jgi:hypothetical protein
MSLFVYSGKILANKTGTFSASEGCCCSNRDPDDPRPDPPSGPNCGCAVFSDCTVQVAYEGLTVLLPLRFVDVRTYYKEYGINALGSAGISLTIFLQGNSCSNGAVFINGTCGVSSVSKLYHLSILYGNTLNPGAQNQWRAYYRFNLDADANQPCPAERAGRNVTVSEVQRYPSFSVINNPADCYLNCGEIITRITAANFGPVPFFKWQNVAWATYSGGNSPDPIRGALGQSPEDEFWPCGLPIWNATHPRVSVICPP